MLRPKAGGAVYAAIVLSIKLPEAHAAHCKSLLTVAVVFLLLLGDFPAVAVYGEVLLGLAVSEIRVGDFVGALGGLGGSASVCEDALCFHMWI